MKSVMLSFNNLIFTALIEKFEQLESEGKVFLHKNVSNNNNKIRFNTPYSFKLFPKLEEQRKSLWKTDFMFCYEIDVEQLCLYAVVKCDLTKSEHEKCKKIFMLIDKKFHKKSFEENWDYWSNLSTGTRKIEMNFNEMSDEEFYAKKDDIIDPIFVKLMENIKEFEDKLKKGGFDL